MSLSIPSFIKDLSFETLDDYLASKGERREPPFAKSKSRKALQDAAVEYIQGLGDEFATDCLADFERIDELQRGAPGERALNLAALEWRELKEREDTFRHGRDRALWLFANDIDRFKQTEKNRFIERYIENEHHWTSFAVLGSPNLPGDFQARIEGRFIEEMNALLAQKEVGPKRRTEATIWRRPNPRKRTRDRGGVQVTIQRSNAAKTQTREVDNKFEEEVVKLISELGLIFNQEQSVLEVVAPNRDKKLRLAIAQLFSEVVLGLGELEESPKLLEFNLQRLSRRHDFSLLAQHKVDAARLTRARFKRPDDGAPIYDIRCMSDDDDVWTVAGRDLQRATRDSLGSVLILHVWIEIDFSAVSGRGRRTRTLELDVSGASNLRSWPSELRAIVEELLDHWELRKPADIGRERV